jgi:hypothetical protein
MNWSGRRVEVKLLAISFCSTKYGMCGSFLEKVWSPCASKVEDLYIAAFETAGDTIPAFLNFVVFVRMLTTVIHARCPCSGTNMSAFFGMKTRVNYNYLRET